MPWHFSTRLLLSLLWLVIGMSSALMCGSISPSRMWLKSVGCNCGMPRRMVPPHIMTSPQREDEPFLDEDFGDSLYAGNEFQNITILPPPQKTFLENNASHIPKGFVDNFRIAAPFLQAHRGKIFVIHINGNEIQMHKHRGSPYLVVDELPITTPEALSIAMESAGRIRFEVENIMSAGHMPGVSKVGVCSGNFYTAIPIGVRGGVDFMYSGTVQHINVEKIKRRVTEEVVQLSCIGYSSTGKAYRVQTEDLASLCAQQLGAAKLIYVTEGEQLVGYRKDGKGPDIIPTLPFSQAKCITMDVNARIIPPSHKELQLTPRRLEGNKLRSCRRAYGRILGYCADAVGNGVKRAHIVSMQDGEILKEIFTPEGSGLLVLNDIYGGIRKAKKSDLKDIMDITTPLIQKGILKERSEAELEKDLKHFVVVLRDEAFVGCAMLKMYDSKYAEISCLAVHPKFRMQGIGESLLGCLERRAFASGLEYCFILSTVTMTWFAERGYEELPLEELPSVHQHLYNWKRNPKVYRKSIMYRRTDMDELLWHL